MHKTSPNPHVAKHVSPSYTTHINLHKNSRGELTLGQCPRTYLVLIVIMEEGRTWYEGRLQLLDDVTSSQSDIFLFDHCLLCLTLYRPSVAVENASCQHVLGTIINSSLSSDTDAMHLVKRAKYSRKQKRAHRPHDPVKKCVRCRHFKKGVQFMNSKSDPRSA